MHRISLQSSILIVEILSSIQLENHRMKLNRARMFLLPHNLACIQHKSSYSHNKHACMCVCACIVINERRPCVDPLFSSFADSL